MLQKTVYLSLGSNMGARQQNLQRALARLNEEGITVTAQSSFYETEPQDILAQPWFLNLCVECETRLFPLQLLNVLQGIERELGRARLGKTPKGPRIIDIDILLFGNTVMETPRLTLPHPRMLERRFMLEPLLEIAPALRHPGTKELFSKPLGAIAGQKVRKRNAQT